MAVVMSITLTVIRSGMHDGWIEAAMTSALIAYPIALVATLLLGPLVRGLVAKLTEPVLGEVERDRAD
jgi:hypothetical protein